MSQTPRSQSARAATRAGLFAATTAAMLVPFAVAQAVARGRGVDFEPARARWVQSWARALVARFGASVMRRDESTSAHPSAPKAGRLIISNHRSALDIGVLLSEFPGRMVSRADLARWPLIGLAARQVGTVFVERSSRQSGAEVAREIEALLRAGDDVLVFPEATTFAGDLVRPFKAGALRAATRAGALVLPVGLAYATGSSAAYTQATFAEHLRALAGSSATRVCMVVGAEFAAADAEPAEHARRVVQALVDTARAAVDAREPNT